MILRFRPKRPQWRPPDPTEPPEGWVQPWWAERQRDPNSTAYAPQRSHYRRQVGDEEFTASVLTNTIGRTWTLIGLPESGERTAVDPRGMVMPGVGRWSIDWWVRAGDEWIFPSRSANVRQRLIDSMPVVETLLRVGGGDVIHRVAAARAGSSVGDALEAVVVEITNGTAGPIAVALAARPFGLSASEQHVGGDGFNNGGRITALEVDAQTLTVSSGWERTVLFDRLPGDVVSGAGGTDCADKLIAAAEASTSAPTADVSVAIRGAAAEVQADDAVGSAREQSVSVECEGGLANAAAVFPLVAGSTLRMAMLSRAARTVRVADAVMPPAADAFATLPPAERVANGWRLRIDAATRLVLPSGRLAEAALATRASLLLGTRAIDERSGTRGTKGTMLTLPPEIEDQAEGDDLVQLLGMVESGDSDAIRDLAIWQAQTQDGKGCTTSLGLPVTGSTSILAEHLLSLHPDPALAEALGEFATSAARWLLTQDGRTEAPWAIREGLRADYRMLRRLKADRAARELRSAAMSLPQQCRVDPGVPASAERFYLDSWGRLRWETLADAPNALDEDRRLRWEQCDGALWVHAAVPWAPTPPFVMPEAPDLEPAQLVVDADGSRGCDMMATALLAFAEARPAPARAYRRLDAMVSVASSTLNWPTFMHPQLHTGTDGAGHDLRVGGLFVRTLLRLLADVPDDGGHHAAGGHPSLRIAAHWPASWLGQPVEVHDVPTRIGKVSWAIRWHGERPALLWDVVPHDPAGAAPSMTVPGLDPAFAATEWSGEALLAPVPAPAE
ncbi:hypothetical protein [Candidatus Poriferisodalis sp.]|uniref:hypothetical protein n=1 Tax=Candidatus Poriferisodalis sp. TaxID=3101277 RepID=UPI003D1157BF